MKPQRRTGRKKKAKAVSLPNIRLIEVDNPNYQREHAESRSNPRRIECAFNPNESYIGWLHVKNKITDAEYKAAGRVRQAFEAMGGAGASAIDYSRDAVDGGRIAEPITPRQMQAGITLRDVHASLGPQGHDLVLRIAGEGCWPRDLSPDPEGQRYLRNRLKECLEHLAVHWGYQQRRIVYARPSA